MCYTITLIIWTISFFSFPFNDTDPPIEKPAEATEEVMCINIDVEIISATPRTVTFNISSWFHWSHQIYFEVYSGDCLNWFSCYSTENWPLEGGPCHSYDWGNFSSHCGPSNNSWTIVAYFNTCQTPSSYSDTETWTGF